MWQKNVALTVYVYKLTASFPESEKFNLTSQINRAAVSIASNIAEGAGRNSSKEFVRFLSIAHGSCFELETQFIIANKLAYITDIELEDLLNLINELQRMNYKLQYTLGNMYNEDIPLK